MSTLDMGMNRVNGDNRKVVEVSGNYTASCNDDVIIVKGTEAAPTILLPGLAPTNGRRAAQGDRYTIIDGDGSAGTNPITVAIDGGGQLNGTTVIGKNQGADFIWGNTIGGTGGYCSESSAATNVLPTVVVFKPGGTAGFNVYTTMTAIAAAIAGVPGPIIIQCDGSANGDVCPVETGLFNLGGPDVTFVSANNAVAGLVELRIPNGARFVHGFNAHNLRITYAGNALPCINVASGVREFEFFACDIVTTGGQSFMEASGTGLFVALLQEGSSTSGQCFSATGAAALASVRGTGSVLIQLNTLKQAAGATVFATVDGTATSIDPTQIGTVTFLKNTAGANLGMSDAVAPALGSSTAQGQVDAIKASLRTARVVPGADVALPATTPTTVMTATGLVVPANGTIDVTGMLALLGGAADATVTTTITLSGGPTAFSVTIQHRIIAGQPSVCPLCVQTSALAAGTYNVVITSNASTASTAKGSAGSDQSTLRAQVCIG